MKQFSKYRAFGLSALSAALMLSAGGVANAQQYDAEAYKKMQQQAVEDARKMAEEMAKASGVDPSKMGTAQGAQGVDIESYMNTVMKNPGAFASRAQGVPDSYPPMVFDDKRPTRLLWGNMLDNINVEPDGRYKSNAFLVLFPPYTDVDGNEIEYNKHRQERMHLQIIHDGDMIADHYYSGTEQNRVSTYFSKNKTSVRNVNPDFMDHYAFMKPGNYEFRFMIDDTPFQVATFRLDAIESDDPYVESDKVFMASGLWEEYLGVGFASSVRRMTPMGQPDTDLYLQFYARNNDPQTAQAEYYVFAEVYRDGKQIGNSRAHVEVGHQWEIQSPSVRTGLPGDPNGFGEDIEFKDMKDGKYKVVMYHSNMDADGNHTKVPGAKSATYEFEFKDGKFVLPRHSDLRRAKKNQIVDGGGSVVWVKPKSGTNPWETIGK